MKLHEDFYETVKKLARNSEYWKYGNFKKLSALEQIHCFV